MTVAGKVLGIEQGNLDRVLRDLKEARNERHSFMRKQDLEFYADFLNKQHEAEGEAEIAALITVCHARDTGKIAKRNVLKLDRKVNSAINSYLRTEKGREYKLTLPERIA